MKPAVLAIGLLYIALPASAKEQPECHSAKVLSQEIGTYENGLAVVPMGTMVAGVPLRHRSNVVTVQTTNHRLTLSEQGNKTVVLSVNEEVQVCRDGNWFVVLDSTKKKHKFSLVHLEAIENGSTK